MATSSFDDVVGQVSIGRLERELEGDQRRFRRMLEQYEALRFDLQELNDAIQRRKRFLEALREIAGAEAVGEGATPQTPTDLARPTTKPEMVRRILFESLDPLYPRQVRNQAVERGWLPNNAASRNQLGVAMSKMARTGRLLKDDQGRYGLPDTG